MKRTNAKPLTPADLDAICDWAERDLDESRQCCENKTDLKEIKADIAMLEQARPLVQAALCLFSALETIVRCAKIKGPAGTTAYIISDDRIATARALVEALRPAVNSRAALDIHALDIYRMARGVVNRYESAIRANEEINGAELVDFLVQYLYPEARKILGQ